MKVRSLVVEAGVGPALVESEVADFPAHGMARLSPVAVGLCRTDLAVASGKIKSPVPRLILGHEVCARVVSTGAGVEGLENGTLVCVFPKTKRGFLGLDRDGTLADLFDVEACHVFAVPSGSDPFVCAYSEPVAAAMSVLGVGLDKGREVLVYGENRIASLVGMVLAAHGHNVTTGRPKAGSGPYFQIVETETGAGAWEDIQSLLAPGGLLVLKSRGKTSLPLDVSRWVSSGWRMASAEYSDFKEAIDWALDNEGVLRDLFGPVHDVSKWEAAFSEAEESDSKKVFLTFG